MSLGLKVHLRVVELHGVALRVVTLRPQTAVTFSTNRFHETWHILSDPAGAAILGRLLFGLAYQRRPGTLVMIGAPHLVPTPFDGDPADPILLVPDGLTSIDADRLCALRYRLRRAPQSPTTIRWHTFGMPRALAERDARGYRRVRHPDELYARERMSRIAGFVCYTAPPALLIESALSIYDMGPSGYLPLADRRWPSDGEFQTIPGWRDKVSSASVARREVVGERKGLVDETERLAIWRQADRTLARLTRAKRS